MSINKKPVVSVITPTLGRDTLYPLISNLLKQKTDFAYEIVLISQVKLKENLLKNEKVKIFYEPLGKGIAYYRNVGILKSKGGIIVFIDDDELPMDTNWLTNITNLIFKRKETVVTAGVKIKLGQGYLTDCISLLGFPGGGAIGFEIMWPLKEGGYTDHICSGNLAIGKSSLKKVGNFSESFKSGNEDVNLAEKIISNKIKIKYLEETTVYHVARKGLINFIKWNILRGKSAGDYIYSGKNSSGKIVERLSSSLSILKKIIITKPLYLPGVLFVMFNQYLWQVAGMLRKNG